MRNSEQFLTMFVQLYQSKEMAEEKVVTKVEKAGSSWFGGMFKKPEEGEKEEKEEEIVCLQEFKSIE